GRSAPRVCGNDTSLHRLTRVSPVGSGGTELAPPLVHVFPPTAEDPLMLGWSIVFLVVALVAGVLGMTGVAAISSNIAWILFVVFLILFVVSLLLGRRPRAG